MIGEKAESGVFRTEEEMLEWMNRPETRFDQIEETDSLKLIDMSDTPTFIAGKH
ncbi:hypothetical protein J4E08_11050 [Sagittula sp. NFXS13]|uniref:hypothetical protein n=1 Tax=Sagittula sp. NFXS13 TaxID=2819095 RepID=UPI0032DFCD0A